MFSLKQPSKAPLICPHCPYAPATLVDLKVHLVESHEGEEPDACRERDCGVASSGDIDAKEDHALVHKRRKTNESDKGTGKKLLPSPSQSLCTQHIIRDTKKYLSTLQNLAKSLTTDLNSCADFPLIALVSHALTVRRRNSEGKKRGRTAASIAEFLELTDINAEKSLHQSKSAPVEVSKIPLDAEMKLHRLRAREGGGTFSSSLKL